MAAAVLALAAAGCAGSRPAEDLLDRLQTGIASYYAHKFHGRTTASGAIYDENAMTAAHPALPFGTRVRVTNRENGRSVVLLINDRGPFIKGRIIDVSFRAARELDFVRQGLVEVRVEVLE